LTLYRHARDPHPRWKTSPESGADEMTMQNKSVSIAVDASAIKSLQRASAALSELANGLSQKNDDTCSQVKRATR
jgi:hypothetical protein